MNRIFGAISRDDQQLRVTTEDGPRCIYNIISSAGLFHKQIIIGYDSDEVTIRTLKKQAQAKLDDMLLMKAKLGQRIMEGEAGLVGKFILVDFGRPNWAILYGKIIQVNDEEEENPGILFGSFQLYVKRLLDPKVTVILTDSEEEMKTHMAAMQQSPNSK